MELTTISTVFYAVSMCLSSAATPIIAVRLTCFRLRVPLRRAARFDNSLCKMAWCVGKKGSFEKQGWGATPKDALRQYIRFQEKRSAT